MATYEDLLNQISEAGTDECPNVPAVYDVHDKRACTGYYADYFISRLMAAVEYDNLPDHIDGQMIWFTAMTRGTLGWIGHEGLLWPLAGSNSMAPNKTYSTTPQGRANGYMITCPQLNIARQYTVGEDCVVMRCDPLGVGLLPTINRYATLLAENDISLFNVDTLMRALFIISCSDDGGAKGAKAYIQSLIDGEPSYLCDDDFLEKLSVSPGSGTSQQTLKALIEYHQYLRGTAWNDFGLQANWNNKREAINEAETGMNEPTLLPYFDISLKCQQMALDEVWEKWPELCPKGRIVARLSSAWELLREEVQNETTSDDNPGGDSELDDGGAISEDGGSGADTTVDG